MPNEIEKLIDALFLEPYGLDDCMEIMRMTYQAFDFKGYLETQKSRDSDGEYEKAEDESSLIGKLKERLKSKKILDIYVSYKGEYKGHYRLHSEKAISVLQILSASKEKSAYLENKITGFFKSFEWETWAWKYAESSSDSLPYKVQKKNNQVSDNTALRQRRK